MVARAPHSPVPTASLVLLGPLWFGTREGGCRWQRLLGQAGIHGIPESVTERVEREDRHGYCQAREDRYPRCLSEVPASIVHDASPRRLGRLYAEPEEPQVGLEDNHGSRVQRGHHDNRRGYVG